VILNPEKESSFWSNLPVNRYGDGATENDFGDISTLSTHLGANIPAPASLKWCDFSTEALQDAKFDQVYKNLGSLTENSDETQENISIFEMMSFSTCYTKESCRHLMLPKSGSVEWIGLEEGTISCQYVYIYIPLIQSWFSPHRSDGGAHRFCCGAANVAHMFWSDRSSPFY
jgi:hypothetical protein